MFTLAVFLFIYLFIYSLLARFQFLPIIFLGHAVIINALSNTNQQGKYNF